MRNTNRRILHVYLTYPGAPLWRRAWLAVMWCRFRRLVCRTRRKGRWCTYIFCGGGTRACRTTCSRCWRSDARCALWTRSPAVRCWSTAAPVSVGPERTWHSTCCSTRRGSPVRWTSSTSYRISDDSAWRSSRPRYHRPSTNTCPSCYVEWQRHKLTKCICNLSSAKPIYYYIATSLLPLLLLPLLRVFTVRRHGVICR